MANYYRVLGVSVHADQEEIRNAYHELVREYHPDLRRSDVDAESRIREINKAYEVLGNTRSRQAYDDGRQHEVRPKEGGLAGFFFTGLAAAALATFIAVGVVVWQSGAFVVPSTQTSQKQVQTSRVGANAADSGQTVHKSYAAFADVAAAQEAPVGAPVDKRANVVAKIIEPKGPSVVGDNGISEAKSEKLPSADKKRAAPAESGGSIATAPANEGPLNTAPLNAPLNAAPLNAAPLNTGPLNRDRQREPTTTGSVVRANGPKSVVGNDASTSQRIAKLDTATGKDQQPTRFRDLAPESHEKPAAIVPGSPFSRPLNQIETGAIGSRHKRSRQSQQTRGLKPDIADVGPYGEVESRTTSQKLASLDATDKQTRREFDAEARDAEVPRIRHSDSEPEKSDKQNQQSKGTRKGPVKAKTSAVIPSSTRSLKTWRWRRVGRANSPMFKAQIMSIGLRPGGSFRSVRLTAKRHDILIYDARVHYSDGVNEKIDLKGTIAAGTRTEPQKLPLRKGKPIRRITVTHQSSLNLEGEGLLEVWMLN